MKLVFVIEFERRVIFETCCLYQNYYDLMIKTYVNKQIFLLTKDQV
jgi:hypothetical protein